MKTIKGRFDIKTELIPLTDTEKRIGANRMEFKKHFQGPLEATSLVSMLGLMNKDMGSGAYVALEIIEGTLEGRQGTFNLQHSSTMNRGKPSQTISVIPDSGTGELVGIEGQMTIEIINGEHFFTFQYLLNPI